jgi:uncharacterized membrane protein
MSTLYITLRETIEFSVIVLLLAGVYQGYRKTLTVTAVLTIFSGSLVAFMSHPLSVRLEQSITALTAFSFIMILLLSCISGKKLIYPIVCIVLAVLFPSAQLASVIISRASLRGGSELVYALTGILACFFVCKIFLSFPSRLDLKRYFGNDGIMVFLAAFCFLFGGLHEFSDSSVITTLQQRIHMFLSSVFLLISDHLIPAYGGTVSTSLGAVFGYLSSHRVAMALTALLLFIPPVYVFIRQLYIPEPSTDNIEKKAEKRKHISVHRDELIRKGTPLLIALSVSIVMLHSANLAMNPLYDPEPIPLVSDGESLVIQLEGENGYFSDFRLRKFSFRSKGRVYSFMVVMRPDTGAVALLDACEICPSGGYVQRGEHLICKYCSTPIPLHSLGQPGGCNPVPVPFSIEGDNLTVAKDDIVSAYDKWVGTD